jgi:hypothetical protein
MGPAPMIRMDWMSVRFGMSPLHIAAQTAWL